MRERDPMDSTIVGHMLATMKDLSNNVMEIKAMTVSIDGKLDLKADKDDLALLRVDMANKASKKQLEKAIAKHSKSPTSHGFILGITRKQMAQLITILTAIVTGMTAFGLKVWAFFVGGQ